MRSKDTVSIHLKIITKRPSIRQGLSQVRLFTSLLFLENVPHNEILIRLECLVFMRISNFSRDANDFTKYYLVTTTRPQFDIFHANLTLGQ